MNFKRFVLFLLLTAGLALHAYAQNKAEAAAKQNNVLAKTMQEVENQINSIKKVLPDSVPKKKAINLPKSDSVNAKVSNEIKAISAKQKSEVKSISSQAIQDVKRIVNTPKLVSNDTVPLTDKSIAPKTEVKQATNQLMQMKASETSKLKSQSIEIKQELKEKVALVKQAANDTVPASKRLNLPDADQVGVTYQDGKIVLPDKMKNAKDVSKLLPGLSDTKLDKTNLPKDVLPANLPSEKDIPNLSKEHISEKVSHGSEELVRNNKSYQSIRNQTDSIRKLVEKGKNLVEEIKGGVPDMNHIYSSKTLKKLYDSLGISRLDSVMALATTQKEVSKEELLQQINASFPSSSLDPKMADLPEISNPSDLESLKNNIPASDLPNTSELTSLKDKVADVNLPDASTLSSMKDKVPMNLSDMKLSMNDLKELAPLRGFQLPTDSIPILDSLQNLDLSREKIHLKQNEIEDRLESAVAKRKPAFWNKAYVDAIISFINSKDVHSFQVSPSVGYRVTNDLSFGIGPNIIIREKHNIWNISMGFRTFAKYELFSQRGYFQIEDMVDPASINKEYISQTRHSILTGAGVFIPISKTVAINFCVLYRVNNDDYSSGQHSPWVVRLGLSSKKSMKKEKLK
jgi:hypothetical protein